MDPVYEICAVRYAHLERTARHNFIGGDAHDGPMPLDYYVWTIRGGGRTFVLDTGFDAAMGAARGRQIVQPVAVGLASVGIATESARRGDQPHALRPLRQSRPVSQRALSPAVRGDVVLHRARHVRGRLRAPYEAADVQAMVGKLFAGRVVFHDGTAELAPGITLHRVGGHTRGLQVMRVHTQRGWVVLARMRRISTPTGSSAGRFPSSMTWRPTWMPSRTIESLASSPQHIIPGHDPLVLSAIRRRAWLGGWMMPCVSISSPVG